MSLTRRDFLGCSLATSAWLACRQPKIHWPSETVGIAVIGVGRYGIEHVRAYSRMGDCEVRTICDVDPVAARRGAAEVAIWQARQPKLEGDMRRVLTDPDIDAVSIATPNHWHALAGIWAMQAGKAVYLEKPVSHHLVEGARLVDAVDRIGGVVQSGMHRRSFGDIENARHLVAEGAIGEIKLVRCLTFLVRPSIGPAGDFSPPVDVDYDLWLGPAKGSALTRRQFHYDWHWFWAWGDGALGNNGVHRIDIARWILGLSGLGDSVTSYGGRLGYRDAGETPSTQVTIHRFEEADVTVVQEVRGFPSAPYKGISNGVIFEGSHGYITVSQAGTFVFDRDGRQRAKVRGGRPSHFRNFIEAIRRDRPQILRGDMREAEISAGLCHVGSIAHRIGQRASKQEIRKVLQGLQLADDHLTRFADTVAHLQEHGVDLDSEPLTLGGPLVVEGRGFATSEPANELLSANYRQGFELPRIV